MFAKKAKPGDICEIKTSKGLAYFQCMRDDKRWGMMIRVLSGTFDERPSDLAAIALQPEQFITFFPLSFALKKKLVTLVGPAPLPPEAQEMPKFRGRGAIDRNGRVLNWYLIDGDREIPIKELTPELRKLSIQAVVNDTALIEMIEDGWTPEQAV